MASSSSSTTSWQRPLQGRLKCNVDASFSYSLNRTDIDMCIRDAEGTFVSAKTFNFSPRCAVPLGEAMGLLLAIQWLSDMAIDHVDIALDSKIVTNAFHKQLPDITEFGHVPSTARSLFSSSFTNSRVEFNRRQANEIVSRERVRSFPSTPSYPRRRLRSCLIVPLYLRSPSSQRFTKGHTKLLFAVFVGRLANPLSHEAFSGTNLIMRG
ncbi:hypothetical protein QL285_004788 [Trifolium repens]|nr:hypothetical protein QL285_004788 [Trifolium repens]